jgi:GT2 family glycosyltransferase
MISIIIVNYNRKDFTVQCLRSLERIKVSVPIETIVVDNASTDGSVEIIRYEFPHIIVLPQNLNGGFGKANNIGSRAAHGDYLYFLNNDTLFQQDSITPLKEFMDIHMTAGIVAPMLLNSDLTYQHSYGKFPSLINELRTKRDTALFKNIPKDWSPRRVDWVSFAAVMIRRSAFEKVYGFDERYFMYFEDADLCFRLHNAGYQSFYCAEYPLIHLGGGSRSHEITNMIKIEYRRSQLLFYASHRSWFELLTLRFYLLFRFSYSFLCTRGEERHRARLVIIMALSSYAHRS